MQTTRACGLTLTILHISFMPLLAQERETVTQAAEWFSANSTINVAKRVAIYTEGNLRMVQNFEPMQIQLRTGVEVELNKHWSIMPLAYAYTWNPQYGKQPATFVNNEHRLFEQLTFKHAIAGTKMSHRFRLEQRHMQTHTLENNAVVDNGYNLFANRLRYRVQAQIPLSSRPDGSALLSAILYDEIFISFGDNVVYHDPDQNRVFAGVAYHFSKTCFLQGGPFYQLLIKAGGTKQENNIGVQFTLTHRLDLTGE